MVTENFWCKVRRFEANTKYRIRNRQDINCLIIQKEVGPKLFLYSYISNGEYYIWVPNNNVYIPSSFQINNFTARQRKHLKDLPHMLESFEAMTLGPCTGCIFENDHIIKGECNFVRENY